MKFGYTILYVKDVPKALAFYEAAFGLKTRMIHDSQTYGELETGETVLAFAARAMLDATGKQTVPPDPAKPVFEVALVTGDVPGAFARAVAAGAAPVSEPAEMPWGQTVSYVTDAEGFLVEICSPISAG